VRRSSIMIACATDFAVSQGSLVGVVGIGGRQWRLERQFEVPFRFSRDREVSERALLSTDLSVDAGDD
jgi:hypothetical protein